MGDIDGFVAKENWYGYDNMIKDGGQQKKPGLGKKHSAI